MRSPSALLLSSWTRWSCATLAAAALSGCSITKLAQQDQKLPKMPKAPEASVVSMPSLPAFGSTQELKHPDKVQLAYGRWQEQQRQPALAREAYQKALDHDPKSVEALLGLSRLDLLAGRSATAAEHLDKAQKLHPQEPLVYAGWGEFYAAQQNWPQAITRYRQAVEMAPDEPLYKHQLAVVLVKSGAVNDGLAAFVALVGQPEAHYNLGVLLHQQGRLVEAEQHLQRALALKPELTSASTVLTKLRRERGLSTAIAAAPATAPAPVTVTAPAAAPSPSAAIIPAAWSAAGATHVQPATYAPTPQQLEQWKNQQSPPR